VSKLIYTSSPSVVFSGEDEDGIDERVPYPKRYLAYYPQTKAIAEQLILTANSCTLSTVALRPHLIWGPGDNHLFPRLVQRARDGKLRRVGDGKNLVDTTYIDNAVDAHLQAASQLSPDSPAAGNAYFISNGQPMPLWDLINQMLACANQEPISRQISATAAYWIGATLEVIYSTLGNQDEPPMTRFVARQLATSHWFRLDAAKRDFGYIPKITIEQGLKQLAESIIDSPSST
jgi:nucleoside-diphosphate-sugar epimerase